MSKPRTYVSAPAFTPLPFGLLSALSTSIRNPSDAHWQAGVNYEAVCALGGTTYDECFAVSGTGGNGAVGPPPSKASTTEITRRAATPFTVFLEIDCSAPGFWDRSDEMINAAFTQAEQWQVEYAFWTGFAANQPVVYPHLTADTQIVDDNGFLLQTAAAPVSGISGPLDIVEGLGALEAALADSYDGIGVIHAPRNLIAPMADAMLIVLDGSRYRTVGGNTVVFGAGYRGTSPAGTSAPGETWMYATGAPFIYRSPTYTFQGREGLDRNDNTLKRMVERNYLLAWDCGHAAVNISTGGIITGAPAGPS
jgi:hypothetical protein